MINIDKVINSTTSAALKGGHLISWRNHQFPHRLCAGAENGWEITGGEPPVAAIALGGGNGS